MKQREKPRLALWILSQIEGGYRMCRGSVLVIGAGLGMGRAEKSINNTLYSPK